MAAFFPAIGAIVTGFTAYSNSMAQAAAAEYNAKIQKNQALVEKYNAESVSQQASAKEEQQRRSFAAFQGEARAGLAQSGTDPYSGSNAGILRQNEISNELDVLNIQYAGSQGRLSHENAANNFLAQSNLSKMEAKRYKTNAYMGIVGGALNAGSSLLSSAASYGIG